MLGDTRLGGSLRKAADLYDKTSGRGVETWTTEPALLTPDSPNQSRFPDTTLRPGQQYHSETEYRFYSR